MNYLKDIGVNVLWKFGVSAKHSKWEKV
jgi:hypothetical protein